jgi:hypothetical protein
MNSFMILAIKGLIVVAVSAALILCANAAMDGFLQSEIDAIKSASDAVSAQKDSAANDPVAEYKLQCLKLQQQELFYQKYCTRDSYHYYGQYYELYENVYNADVWFIGTSHTAHGLNPLYVESECPDRSFFNFALNGSNPKFYEDWWNIVLESGYPMPKTIIWCVDWFMCDDGWLWRTIDFDTAANMPIDIMRRLKDTYDSDSAAADSVAAETEAQSTAETASDGAETSESAKTDKTINWWDVDAVTGEIFSKLSIISSRDRIPDMVKSWFGSMAAETPAEVQESNTSTEEMVLPTFTHKYLRDSQGDITSDYYKGYIPWEANFGGDSSTISCNDNEAQWKAFERVLDKFSAAGIKVIFIELPEYSGVNRIKMNKNNKRIANIASARGIEFYDYNTDDPSGVGADASNYSDWGHMNTKGGTLFSKFLGGEIKKILGE